MSEAEPGDPGRVIIGATVTLRDETTAEAATYRLVGPDDADIGGGRLSVQSPVGRAILGATVGDTVDVTVPDGVRTYTVVEVTND